MKTATPVTGRFGGRHPYSRPLDWASVRRRLCYGKWLKLFPLKLQRNNRQNALAVDPAKGKTGKKAVFSPYCGDEAATCHDRAKEKKAPLCGGFTKGGRLIWGSCVAA